MKRVQLSKRVRFEVFKRDNFTCMYCGRSAPDVVLECDHVDPVANGGTNDIINLVTSCFDCNSGKSSIPLDDQSALAKQRAQIIALNERREQIEMMLEWRNGLKSEKEMELDAAEDAWSEATDGLHVFSKHGRKEMSSLIRKFGLSAVLDAIEVVQGVYLRYDNDDALIADSVQAAFKKIGGVCAVSRMSETEKNAAYVRGILRNRLYRYNADGYSILDDAFKDGADFEAMKNIARSVNSWPDWINAVCDYMREGRQ